MNIKAVPIPKVICKSIPTLGLELDVGHQREDVHYHVRVSEVI